MWGQTEHENQYFKHFEGVTSVTYWTKSCVQVVVNVLQTPQARRVSTLDWRVKSVGMNIGLLWKNQWSLEVSAVVMKLFTITISLEMSN